MNLLRRAICALIGHPDTVIRWGTVRQDGTRQVSEVCCRCAAAVNQATLRLEGERWQ